MLGPTFLMNAAILALMSLTITGASDVPEAGAMKAAWELPRWADPMKGLAGALTADGLPRDTKVEVQYVYPTGESGLVAASPSEGRFTFTIPPAGKSEMGTLALIAMAVLEGKSVQSDVRRVPLSYWQECDISGPAAEVIPYTVFRDDMLVRYIPCCNIYGGVLETERVPVNPIDDDTGLPEQLITDFVVLSPDALSASTMGLHFRMTYDKTLLNGKGVAHAALYTYDWPRRRWIEVQTYEHDTDNGVIDFHAPDGGTFVIGAKP